MDTVADLKQKETRVHPGDHICSIYQTTEQQISVLVPFIKDGLKSNQKCVYISDPTSASTLLSAFEKEGFSIQHYLDTKQFVMLSATEVYSAKVFDPTAMATSVKKMETDALSEGYSGIRGIGEMTQSTMQSEPMKLVTYESSLNTLLSDSLSIILCQYDERTTNQNTLINAIRTHPLIYFYGKLYANKYFYSPPEYMKLSTLHFENNSYTTIVDTIMTE